MCGRLLCRTHEGLWWKLQAAPIFPLQGPPCVCLHPNFNLALPMSERIIQFRQALREAMAEEMERDPAIFLMGEEVAQYQGAYKVSQGLLERFGPKRVIDTPISELGFAGIGVGAAMNGLRPIVEFMTWNFALLAIDQIVNAAAKMLYMSGGQFNVPITFRGPSGFAGQLAAQHSQSFGNWYANVPGLKVIEPGSPYDAKGLLKSAIRDDDPVLVLESELMYNDKGPVPETEYLIPIGQANVVRQGKEATLIAWGKMRKVALDAADAMAKDGYDIEVIDLRTLRPLDIPTLVASLKKTNRAVIVEEAWPLASISAELTFQLQREAFDYLDAPILRCTTADTPAPYAPTLAERFLPRVEDVIPRLKAVMYAD